MDKDAYGLIETKGLVGIIEAADAGVKAADVQLVSCEYATGGLVTIVFVGSVASVMAAVEAGATAAAHVGQLVAKHVIPAPHEDLTRMLGLQHPSHRKNPPKGETLSSSPPEKPHAGLQDLERMRVPELRRYARETPGIDLYGRAISRATKEQLIQAIRKATRNIHRERSAIKKGD